jgi:hypothetical protein
MDETTAKHAAPTGVAGIDLRREICHHDHFFERRGQLNTAFASFFNSESVDPTTRRLICANCGSIHWFVPEEPLRQN